MMMYPLGALIVTFICLQMPSATNSRLTSTRESEDRVLEMDPVESQGSERELPNQAFDFISDLDEGDERQFFDFVDDRVPRELQEGPSRGKLSRSFRGGSRRRYGRVGRRYGRRYGRGRGPRGKPRPYGPPPRYYDWYYNPYWW